jgi:oligopeptide/dipeptide ABC transporter ATP-binding protein
MPMQPVLEVRDLVTEVTTAQGQVALVDGVSFAIDAGKTLAIVGESGCGKSITALSLLRILPEPAIRIAGGKILFDGEDLAAAPETEMRTIRGNSISIIFQDPIASLNPIHSVGKQIIEAIRSHADISYGDARRRTIELLRHVHIPDAEQRIDEYPHRLSGGMCQRVMIAMALACRPKLLIADEPTTALDTTVQAQVMSLLKKAQEETGTAIILITHNLAVARESAEHVAVMYAGRIVEEGDIDAVFDDPRHPYTRGLLGAIPGEQEISGDIQRLAEIKGHVPRPGLLPKGCAFEPRCPIALSRCAAERPLLEAVGPDAHAAACFRSREKIPS